MGKRIVEIDVTSGVLIIKIILAHMCGFLSLRFFLDDVLFFCSPWLAFKAGMFFKMKYDWRGQIRKDIERLFIPFLCFGLFQDTSRVQQWHCNDFGTDYLESNGMAGQVFGLQRFDSCYVSDWRSYRSLLVLQWRHLVL